MAKCYSKDIGLGEGVVVGNRGLDKLWVWLEQGDPSAIHEVRKLSRRVDAGLYVLGASKKVRQSWKVLRRAAAPLRDWDVFADCVRDHLKKTSASVGVQERFEEAWGSERSRRYAYWVLPAQPAALETESLVQKLPKQRLDEMLHEEWAKLKRKAKRSLDSGYSPAWHEWRKRLKRFVHILEFRTEVPPALSLLLKELGRLQDAQLVLDTLGSTDPLVLGLGFQDVDSLRTAQDRILEHKVKKVVELWSELKKEKW